MRDLRFPSKKSFILFFLLVSLVCASVILIGPGEKLIMNAYEKVLSAGSNDYLMKFLDFFPSPKDSIAEENIIILCPDLGRSIEERKATRESVVDALKKIIPFHPSVIAIDVLFDKDDEFFQADSLCALARRNGVELVFACSTTNSLTEFDPALYGYVDCYEESKNRFVPGMYKDFCSFPQLILQKKVGHSVEAPKGLIISPELAGSGEKEYDIDYLDSYYDELEGQTVLLGVDSLKDIWAIDGKSWHILGIELHRGALSTFSRYLNLPSRTIPVWSILLTLFFFFLVYAKVFGQDKRWGAFFARFYDCFVLVIPIILFLLFYHSPTYRYNIWFWRVSAFLLAEILISTLLYPTLPKERQ